MDPTRLHDDPNQNQVQPPTVILIESRPRIDLRGPREWLRTSSCCCTPVIVQLLVSPPQTRGHKFSCVVCAVDEIYSTVRLGAHLTQPLPESNLNPDITRVSSGWLDVNGYCCAVALLFEDTSMLSGVIQISIFVGKATS